MEGNKGGGFKKVLLSIFCGLCFGVFAAISFYAVKEVATAIGVVQAEVNSNRKERVNTIPAREDDIAELPSAREHSSEDVDSTDNESAELLRTGLGTDTVTDVTTVVEEKMPTIVSIVNNYTTSSFYYYNTEAQASGTGIIIGENDEELLIVTNYHVIDKNNSIDVTFCDGSTEKAQVKGTDSDMDLAVIAVALKDLSPETERAIDYAVIGDSDKIKVGQPVIAIGNALGYGQSVTTGVVSAVNRTIGDSNSKFIQTDAAINPGNSGGALMNLSGEVIGINSNKIGGSTVDGMGYAIPISAAKPIIEDLMTKETKTVVEASKQSYLGISGATITSEEAAFYGYPDGVYVAAVYEGSAAAEAGIQKGDFITEFEGEKITSMEQLKRELSYCEGGQEVEMVIQRYGVSGYKETTIKLTLGYRND